MKKNAFVLLFFILSLFCFGNKVMLASKMDGAVFPFILFADGACLKLELSVPRLSGRDHPQNYTGLVFLFLFCSV